MIIIICYLWICLAIALGILMWCAIQDIMCLLKIIPEDGKFGYNLGTALPFTLCIIFFV